MKWSDESNTLADVYAVRGDNIIVQACPGSGKTTNIKRLWDMDTRTAVYLVFAKANQLEAKDKFTPRHGSEILTLNGLGAKAIYLTQGKTTLDDKKVNNIVKEYFNFSGASSGRSFRQYKQHIDKEWALIKAVKTAKHLVMGTQLDQALYDDIVSTYDLDAYDGMLHDVEKCLELNDSTGYVIDFTDQIRFPALYDYTLPEYDVALCDEVQDFNHMQATLVAKLQAGQYVFVGDRNQSIYGFRGAMAEAMDHLGTAFGCTELPLSITYRCGARIVQEAHAIYPGIQAWEDSPYGEVWHSPDEVIWDGDLLVLCRMNKPLVSLAFDLLKQGIPCHVRGRDIGEGLINLINKREARDVADLISKMSDWYDVERSKAAVREDQDKLDRLEDRYASVMLFIERCALHDPVTNVTDYISTVFSQGKGICLSTVHKAKGLEAQSAYIVEPHLYPIFKSRAKQPWQRTQEDNCQYVAVTRAKERLVYL